MSKSEKVTWKKWVAMVGWAGKTDEERIKIRDSISPARWEQGLRLMRKEWDVRVAAHQPTLRGLTAEHALEQSTKLRNRLGLEGIYPVLIELPSDQDRRTLYGKTEGDPAPPFSSPLGIRFLSSQGEQGVRLGEELRRLGAEIESLMSKLDLGPFIYPDDLKEARKDLPGSDRRRLAELCAEQQKTHRHYLQLWDRAKNVGVDHPTVAADKLFRAIRTIYADRLKDVSPQTLIPMDEEFPAFVRRLTKEDIARQDEEAARAVKKFEEAKAREEQREQAVSRQFGKEGGDWGNLAGDGKILALARIYQSEGKTMREAATEIACASGVSVGTEAIRKKLAVWVQDRKLLPFSGKPGPRPKKRRDWVKGG